MSETLKNVIPKKKTIGFEPINTSSSNVNSENNQTKNVKSNASKLPGWTNDNESVLTNRLETDSISSSSSSINIRYKKNQGYRYNNLSASFEERLFNDKSQLMNRRTSTSKVNETLSPIPAEKESNTNENDNKNNSKEQAQVKPKAQNQNPVNPEKKSQKQMTRAERRALQEKQRAAKAAAKAGGGANANANANKQQSQKQKPIISTQSQEVKPVPATMRYDDPKKRSKAEKSKTINRTPAQKPVALFAHLTQYEKENDILAELKAQGFIHPSVLVLGLQFSEFIIDGGNSRCIAMLNAFKKVIADYKTPPNTSLSRHLTSLISKQVEFLSNCRTLCGSMKTAIRYVKTEISKLSIDLPDEDAKSLLCELIDNFIRDRISLADKIIITNGLKKIKENDVILTYSFSTIVCDLLLEAHQKQKVNFSVVVVDSRPRFEGKIMLKKLVEAGIKCTYILLNGLSYMMHSVTKVIIGASSLLSNGAIMSRVGTAVIAMMAHDYKIPVMVCCETYKFSEGVRLDSFVWNEIGDPDELIDNSNRNPLLKSPFIPSKQSSSVILSDWRDIPHLKLLNLHYDVTPSKYITMVITEMGMIPSTSVPVVLREVTGMGMA